MPPQKQPTNSCSTAQSKAVDAEETSCLQDLPLPAQSLVYKHLDAKARGALLRASRCGRDLVLREVTALKLVLNKLDTAEIRKPLVGLLGKALEAASSGLSVCFTSTSAVTNRQMSAWIGRAARLRGWSSIKDLMLEGPYKEKRVFAAGSHSNSLLGPKQQLMPAALPMCICATLQRLDLRYMSVAITDLNHLAASTQLSSLTFWCCQLPALPTGQNPLTALASLKDLTISASEISCVKGLTQLASFHLCHSRHSADQVLTSLAGCTQLQELELYFRDLEVGPQHVQRSIAISSQLRSLAFCHIVDQQQFDVLLTHGTQLASVTLQDLYLKEDRSMSACSWKSVTITKRRHILEVLANMPLYSLERLQFPEIQDGMKFPTQRPVLHLHAGLDEDPSTDLLRRALANIERCPAWQHSGPCAAVWLDTMHRFPPYFQQSQLHQVLQALSALVSKRLHFGLEAYEHVVDATTAQTLGDAVGPRLTGLLINSCQLHPSFWAAMWAHLPNLQQLLLGEYIEPVLPAARLVSYCMNAPRPLQIKISDSWQPELDLVWQAQQLLKRAGVTLVTVVDAEAHECSPRWSRDYAGWW